MLQALRRSLGPEALPLSRTARWARRAATLLWAAALLILPLSLAVRFTAESGWWWERGFDQYDAERRTGLPRAELDRGAAALRAYFRSDEELPTITVTSAQGEMEPLFSERELLHLRDVKRLLNRTYDAGWAALGFIVAYGLATIYWRRGAARRAFGWAALQAGAAIVALIVALGVIALTGFDAAFRQFHLLFFTNDLWQLSADDRLIQMFPQDFFLETTLLIGGVVIATAVALAALGWFLLRPAGGTARA